MVFLNQGRTGQCQVDTTQYTGTGPTNFSSFILWNCVFLFYQSNMVEMTRAT